MKKIKNMTLSLVNEIFSWFGLIKSQLIINQMYCRSQDAKPIIKETTGLYGIKKIID